MDGHLICSRYVSKDYRVSIVTVGAILKAGFTFDEGSGLDLIEVVPVQVTFEFDDTITSPTAMFTDHPAAAGVEEDISRLLGNHVDYHRLARFLLIAGGVLEFWKQ
jgi:hypothetical protein